MKQRNGFLLYGTLLVLGVVLSQAYTNCAPAFLSSDPESSRLVAPLTIDHPPVEKPQPPSQSPPIAHREYIESILTDIFTGPTSSAAYIAAVKYHMRLWVTYQGSPLGLACNMYGSATSRDCGGDVANSNLPIVQPDTIVREALRVRICEELMGYDEAIVAAKLKIPNAGAAPSRATLPATAALFYRGDAPSNEFLESLAVLDDEMKAAGSTDVDRWRMQLMQVCEAPDWQLL